MSGLYHPAGSDSSVERDLDETMLNKESVLVETPSVDFSPKQQRMPNNNNRKRFYYWIVAASVVIVIVVVVAVVAVVASCGNGGCRSSSVQAKSPENATAADTTLATTESNSSHNPLAAAPSVAPSAAPTTSIGAVGPVDTATPVPVPAPAPAPIVASIPILAPFTVDSTPFPADTTAKPTPMIATSISPVSAATRSPTMPPVVLAPREEAIVSLINNSTLSGRVIAGPSQDANSNLILERALRWLIQDDPLQLSPDTPKNEFRLQQRYALRTLFVQENNTSPWDDRTGWANSTNDECDWAGITCGTTASLDSENRSGGVPTLVVTEIDLHFNNLYGILPVDLGLLSSLQKFDVGFNYLVGTLPIALGQWTALQYFSVDYNVFTGLLPTALSQWTALQYFSANTAALTGPLSATLSQWTSLKHFSVMANQLTGLVPAEFSEWTMLETFDVALNALTGRLATEFSAWTALKLFSVDTNVFSGMIPQQYGTAWTSLQGGFFSSNSFTGTVPFGFCSIPKDNVVLYADCLSKVVCDCCDECL